MSSIKLIIVCIKLSLSFSFAKVGMNFSWLSHSSSLMRNNFALSLLSLNTFPSLIPFNIYDKLNWKQKQKQNAFGILFRIYIYSIFQWSIYSNVRALRTHTHTTYLNFSIHIISLVGLCFRLILFFFIIVVLSPLSVSVNASLWISENRWK